MLHTTVNSTKYGWYQGWDFEVYIGWFAQMGWQFQDFPQPQGEGVKPQMKSKDIQWSIACVCFLEILRPSHVQGNVLDMFGQMVVSTELFSSFVNMKLLVAFYRFFLPLSLYLFIYIYVHMIIFIIFYTYY